MTNEIISKSKEKMSKSLDSLRNDLMKIRTGRAHPDILANITIDYYGVDTLISQAANITVLDARTLNISPWEKSLLPKIEKAIISANIGLNPSNMGENLRLPLPALNEERRRDLIKLVRSDGEKARVAIRNIRRDANSEFKDMEKNKDISEDDLKRSEESIQKLTDNTILEVEKITTVKERDLMEI